MKKSLVILLCICAVAVAISLEGRDFDQSKKQLDLNSRNADFSKQRFHAERLAGDSASHWAYLYKSFMARTMHVYTILPTPDEGLLLSGHSTDNGYWLMKLSSQGEIIWAQGHFVGGALHKTTDGGYVITGNADSGSSGDIYVAKLNSDFSIDWRLLYGDWLADSAHSITQTADKGYIVSGESFTYEAPEYRDPYLELSICCLVLKLSPLGQIQWQKWYGGLDFSRHGSREQYTILDTGNGYLLAGSTNFYGSGLFDIWLIKLDLLGNVVWQRVYGGQENENFYTPGPNVQMTAKGDFIVAGLSSSTGSGTPDLWVFKVNPKGDIIWQKSYDGGLTEYPVSIQKTSDGGVIVLCSTNSFGSAKVNLLLLKLSSDTGDIQWQKAYGVPNWSDPCTVCETAQGDFVIVGKNYDPSNSSVINLLVAKVSSTGEIAPADSDFVSDAHENVKDTHFVPSETSMVPYPSSANISQTSLFPRQFSLKPSLLSWNWNQAPRNIRVFQDVNRGLFQGESYKLISWEPNPLNTPFNITVYKIYRKQANTSFDFVFLAKVSGNSLSFEDKTIDLEKEYLYAVSSVDINGNESVLSEAMKEN